MEGKIINSLIIIIPAYNEESTIHNTITSLKAISPKLHTSGCELLIYVINDGSSDNTENIAKNAGADKVIKHPVNQGLGAAVRTGLRRAREDGADIVVKFDADLQHDPSDIIDLIQPIINDEAYVVYGNRFKRIGYRMPFVRRIGNVVFTKIMGWLTNWPIKDSQPGIFAVNSAYLKSFYLPGDYNYTQQILIDAYHKGLRFAHVDLAFSKRNTGKSFVSLRYPFKVLPQIVQVLIGVKPLKVFGTVGFLFLAIGFIVVFLNLIDWIFGDATRPIQNVNLVLGLGTFGLQTVFFGLLADLLVKLNRNL